MTLRTIGFITAILLLSSFAAAQAPSTAPSTAPAPSFKVLALHNLKVETAHKQFARDAIAFYTKLAAERNFAFETTTDWSKLNAQDLAGFQLVVWLNDSPHNAEQRAAFEKYMESGGGWLGFHVAGYNDKDTKWPWFVQFMGGAVFYTNNWPVMPAKLIVDTNKHPITEHLPANYLSPANEFYRWVPSPRLSRDVQVLLTLDPANYPLGKKDLITDGDVPVVWTNTKYRMLYINMGHGDKILSDETQNKLFADAMLWVVRPR